MKRIETAVMPCSLGIVAATAFADWASSTSRIVPAVVTDKSYGRLEPPSAADGAGSATPQGFVLSAESEGWSGDFETDAATWDDAEKGGRVILRIWRGGLFGGCLAVEVVARGSGRP
jgi:hypothetical protein